MLILGVSGSSAKSRRTSALINQCLKGARVEGAETRLLDLSEIRLEFADGRRVEQYDQPTQEALRMIRQADGYIFGSPMYRGSVTGALKNLIDLIPDDYVIGKSAGVVATGGSDHHYLGVELGFRTAMNFFRMHQMPSILYKSTFIIDDGVIQDAKIIEEANKYGQDLTKLVNAVNGMVMGPTLY